jgi:hypothetical protein
VFKSRRVDAIDAITSGSPIWGEVSLKVWCDADTSPQIVNLVHLWIFTCAVVLINCTKETTLNKVFRSLEGSMVFE